MFDNIGWAEIFTIVIIGLIIIGPEKLPGVIKDVRAAIFAARRAISNARAELDGQFGEEFDEFREPINKVAQWQRMGPKRALTQALFDGDEEYLEDFDPKKIMSSGNTAGAAHRARQQRPPETERVERNPETVGDGIPEVAETQRPPRPPSQDTTAQAIAEHSEPREQRGGGFSWADVT